MRILPITIKRTLGCAAIAAAAYVMPTFAQKVRSSDNGDTFTRIETVSPTGTQNPYVLSAAPSPEFFDAGVKKNAAIVVDLSQNVLYHYDDKGNAVEAFLVASGKKSSPTPKSVNIVLRVETYPYKTAAATTKRRKSPKSFGPNVIILGEINQKTGEKVETGIYIHGNNDYKSLGHYESGGCIRMDNQVIKKLAKLIKRGHYVLIK